MRTISLLALLLLLTASGCQHYVPYGNTPGLPEAQPLPAGQAPKIYASSDLDGDQKIALARGYRAIGHAAFNGDLASLGDLARSKGAALVLLKSRLVQNRTLLLPPFTPGSPARSAPAATDKYSGTSEIAILFVKSGQKLKFGLFLIDLPADLRTRLKRNSGALVEAVSENSPAATASILPGDVVIDIAGTPIKSGSHAAEVMRSTHPPDGRCTIKLLRNGSERSVQLRLE